MPRLLNKNGKPLMPTSRGGRVRILLKSGLAKVVSSKPFTVQLLYDCPDETQPLVCGIDPGRTNIGYSVIREDGTKVFEAHVTTRNKDIPKRMAERKVFRNAHRHLKRRCKRQRRAKTNGTLCKDLKNTVRQGITVSDKSLEIGVLERKLPGCKKTVPCVGIRNKESRFNNRIRSNGWLTPTANQLLETHINFVKKIAKFLPITDVVVEANKFAFMALDNPNIQKWQYQRGSLYGKGSVNEAVDAMQDGHCLMCGGIIKHHHHLVPRHLGGSDTIDNIIGLCDACHNRRHTDEKFQAKMAEAKTGINKKYTAASVVNQIIPRLADELGKLYPLHAFVTNGYSTKLFREANGLKKDHYIDAYCIACSILNSVAIDTTDKPYEVLQYRRHDRKACHQAMMNRKYKLGKKVVAVNRHKASEQLPGKNKKQTSDSLEEYVAKGGNVTHLTVPKHPARYRRVGRYQDGSILECGDNFFVLQGSSGTKNNKPDYYLEPNGARHGAAKCTFVANNTGLVFF